MCSMNGSTEAPGSVHRDRAWAGRIKPEMKCASRDGRSSLATMTGAAFLTPPAPSRTFGGKKKEMGLGSADAVTRADAKRLREAVAEGRDPLGERRRRCRRQDFR
jgi:hypothetical protein